MEPAYHDGDSDRHSSTWSGQVRSTCTIHNLRQKQSHSQSLFDIPKKKKNTLGDLKTIDLNLDGQKEDQSTVWVLKQQSPDPKQATWLRDRAEVEKEESRSRSTRSRKKNNGLFLVHRRT